MINFWLLRLFLHSKHRARQICDKNIIKEIFPKDNFEAKDAFLKTKNAFPDAKDTFLKAKDTFPISKDTFPA